MMHSIYSHPQPSYLPFTPVIPSSFPLVISLTDMPFCFVFRPTNFSQDHGPDLILTMMMFCVVTGSELSIRQGGWALGMQLTLVTPPEIPQLPIVQQERIGIP